MKIERTLIIISCCMLLAACNKEEVADTSAERKVIIRATVQDEATSRVNIITNDPDMTVGEKFEWTTGDKIYVDSPEWGGGYDIYATGVNGSYAEFSIGAWSNDKSGISTVIATYPGGTTGMNLVSSCTVDMPMVQTQAGTSTTHINGLMRMAATTSVDYSGTGDLVMDLKFKQLTSLFRFCFLNDTEEELEIKKIVLSAHYRDNTPVKYLFLEDLSFSPSFEMPTGLQTIPTMTLNISPNGTFSTTAAGKVFNAYMGVLGMAKLSTGGNIGGTDYASDKFYITVSILNEAQQDVDATFTLSDANLANLLNSDFVLSNNGASSRVIFKPGSRYYFNLKLAKDGSGNIVLQ